jgi:hypothetical protein
LLLVIVVFIVVVVIAVLVDGGGWWWWDDTGGLWRVLFGFFVHSFILKNHVHRFQTLVSFYPAKKEDGHVSSYEPQSIPSVFDEQNESKEHDDPVPAKMLRPSTEDTYLNLNFG